MSSSNDEQRSADDPTFDIALSGGGHRASLLAMGALLALVDRGLNERVRVVSSVSGGSITNAVIAYKADYRSLTPGELDDDAREFVDGICRNGLFSVAPAVLFCAALSAGALAVCRWIGMAETVTTAVVVVVLLASLMLSGMLLTFQLNSTYFGRRIGWLPRNNAEGVKLEELDRRSVEHVFCATDLVTGLPVTFSFGGTTVTPTAYRRTPGGLDDSAPATVASGIGTLQLADVVRASAAFPGIAPKLIRFDQSPDGLGHTGFCADGGVWNNLATQSLREERRHPFRPVLCINASAAPKRVPSLLYWIPGVALGAALGRIAAIMSRNTVDPRIEAITDDLRRRWSPGATHPPSDVVVVADMRPIRKTVEVFRTLLDEDGQGSDVASFRATFVELIASHGWAKLVANDGEGKELRTKTTLAKVARADARLLLLRGYVNTWVASLVVDPEFTGDEFDGARISATDFLVRLDKIAGE